MGALMGRATLLLLCIIACANSLNACSTRCVEENCDNMGIKYGKFCGVGHGGCPGQKPCDAVDKCCKGHDECVERRGVFDQNCHKKFIRCLDKQLTSGKQGFSKKCPYNQVIPTMKNGIELAMQFGSLMGGASDEL